MNRLGIFRLIAIVFCVLVLMNGTAVAQTSRGTLTGVITDPTGAAVVTATVTITHLDTNVKRQTTTNDAGVYRFDAVDLGTYSLSVQKTGFRTHDTSGVAIQAAHTTDIDVRLEVGATSEVVRVEASSFEVELQTSDQVRGANFSENTVNSLPITGLDSLTLAQLLPGVAVLNQSIANSINQDGTFAFAVNGQRPRGNNFMIDGVENNDISVTGPAYIITNPDAVQEVNIQTADFSAEFGRSGAAVLNATIKSGTNQFHGAAWEFFRNDKLDAADFFENAGGIPKGELRQNQFGFTAGGPVIIPKLYNGRNKLFFFGDYEGLRRVQGTVLTGSVPTTAERSSGYTDFADLITGQFVNGQPVLQTDALGRTMPTGTILDPATTRQIAPGVFVRDPFGTCASAPAGFAFTLAGCNLNQLPAGRLDANAIKLLKAMNTTCNRNEARRAIALRRLVNSSEPLKRAVASREYRDMVTLR